MPIYPLKCPACHWSGEKVAPMSARHGLRCDCGSTLDTDFANLLPARNLEYGNGHGAASMTEGCHPTEVKTYEKACPSLRTTPDGSFVWNNKSHQRQCRRELARYEKSLSRA